MSPNYPKQKKMWLSGILRMRSGNMPARYLGIKIGKINKRRSFSNHSLISLKGRTVIPRRKINTHSLIRLEWNTPNGWNTTWSSILDITRNWREIGQQGTQTSNNNGDHLQVQESCSTLMGGIDRYVLVEIWTQRRVFNQVSVQCDCNKIKRRTKLEYAKKMEENLEINACIQDCDILMEDNDWCTTT